MDEMLFGENDSVNIFYYLSRLNFTSSVKWK